MVLDLCGLCEAKHPRKQDTVKMVGGWQGPGLSWVEKQNSVEQNHSSLSMNIGKRNYINSHNQPDRNTWEDGFYGQRLGALGSHLSCCLCIYYTLLQGKA